MIPVLLADSKAGFAQPASAATIISTATYGCYAHNRQLGMSATAAARLFGAQAATLEARFLQGASLHPH